MPKKSILILLLSFNKGGGAEWVITHLANELVEKGVLVTLFSIKGGTMLKELRKEVNIIQPNFSKLKSFFQLMKLMNSENFEIVFTTQRGAAIFTYLAKLLAFSKIKHVIREPASNFNFSFQGLSFLKKEIVKVLFKLSYRNSETIIVNSDRTGLDLIESGIIDNEIFFIISNPLDIKYIQKKSLEPVLYSDFRGINVITIGRLVKHKRIDKVIEAFSLLIEENNDSKLFIVGEGPEENSLKKLSSKLGIREKIEFCGFLDNPYPLLKKCDVFVLASEWEGFGMVIVEALALGTPVVVNDIPGGTRKILEDGKYGKLVDGAREESIFNSVKLVLESEIVEDNLIDHALKFDKVKIVQKYYQVLFEKNK
jgi:glycosyltransferase involved in cell wall biosynthesis